jgi:hypothetical protein
MNFGFSCKNMMGILLNNQKTRIINSFNVNFFQSKLFMRNLLYSIYSKYLPLGFDSLKLTMSAEDSKNILNKPIVELTTMRRKKLKMKKHKSTKRREALKKRQTSKLK